MDRPDKPNANKRAVLILNTINEPVDWHDKFLSFNWFSLVATNVSDCIKLLEKNDIKIAVALISIAYQKKAFNLIKKINSLNESIKWLAIFVDEKIPDKAIIPEFNQYFFDYHHLPIDWNKLTHSLGHAYGMAALKKDDSIRKKDTDNIPEITGQSDIIIKLKQDINKIAQSDNLTLINGETGTGKGLCAQTIHFKSARKNGPLITVNCGALPAGLIHSELFGHEKGAFTGATNKYIGHIERADKGTLFLDEIGDLSPKLQINLLYFLEEHKIQRLGGSKQIPIDCRIIAATHIDLEMAMSKGTFREDLYHRLNILRFRVPNLRERREDIELIAENCLQNNQQSKKLYFSSSALKSIRHHDWPGNVRELKNRIQRGVVMAEGNKITEQDMGILFNTPPPQQHLPQQYKKISPTMLRNRYERIT